jgi:ribosome biogenesis GTPase / thiamine phosphate phosphatase
MPRQEDFRTSSQSQPRSLTNTKSLIGLVVKVYGRFYFVWDKHTQTRYRCTLRGRLKKTYYPLTNIVVVGDWVTVTDINPGEEDYLEGVIDRIEERRNSLSRADSQEQEKGAHAIARRLKSMNPHRTITRDPREQVLVANVDQVLIVNAIQKPELKPGFIDRVLCSCELEGISPLLVFNKMDLPLTERVDHMLHLYQKLSYPVVLTSMETEQGVEELKQLLKGKISVLCGQSGVGKSTIINRILGDERLWTQEVSEVSHRGIHTTTNAEAIPLPQSGYIIDTPGIREFGLFGVEPTQLATLFIEMYEYINQCKFGNKCTHNHEPSCAIKEAVEAGQIASERYESYLRILDSLED